MYCVCILSFDRLIPSDCCCLFICGCVVYWLLIGVVEGGMAMPPMPIPPPTEDHPDMYISEEVKMFLPFFHHKFKEKVGNIIELKMQYEGMNFSHKVLLHIKCMHHSKP